MISQAFQLRRDRELGIAAEAAVAGKVVTQPRIRAAEVIRWNPWP